MSGAKRVDEGAGGPRVRLLDAAAAPLPARRSFAGGDPGPIVTSLAHVPELLEVALPFFSRALAGATVSPRTAELVIVRASTVLGCTYCTLTHAAIALDADVSPDELRTLCDPSTPAAPVAADGFEAALLAWVDEVAGGHGQLPDAVADRLAAHVDDATLVELTAMAGCTIMLDRYCTALRLPVSPDNLAKLASAGLDPEALAS